MIKSVSVLVMDGVAPFEFGVVCEVFGIDRSADGVPNFDFKVCGPEAGRPVRTSVGASLIPDHGIDQLLGLTWSPSRRWRVRSIRRRRSTPSVTPRIPAR